MKTLCYPHITIGVVKKGPWILGFILAVVAAYLGIDMSADGGQTPTASLITDRTICADNAI